MRAILESSVSSIQQWALRACSGGACETARSVRGTQRRRIFEAIEPTALRRASGIWSLGGAGLFPE
jgi:hypothetical protein